MPRLGTKPQSSSVARLAPAPAPAPAPGPAPDPAGGEEDESEDDESEEDESEDESEDDERKYAWDGWLYKKKDFLKYYKGIAGKLIWDSACPECETPMWWYLHDEDRHKRWIRECSHEELEKGVA